jgi:hypothetical protein
MTDRSIVASRDGVSLAEFLDGDRERLDADGDGAYRVERDDAPQLLQFTAERLLVVDAESGDLFGDVSWHPVAYGPNRASTAWNLGMELLPSRAGVRYDLVQYSILRADVR